MHPLSRAAAATILGLTIVPASLGSPQADPGPEVPTANADAEPTIRFNFKPWFGQKRKKESEVLFSKAPVRELPTNTDEPSVAIELGDPSP